MPLLRNRLVNPFVRALARTPAHRLLGRHLVVLRYTGRRSGRCYELPVMSCPAGQDLVVVSGQHSAKTWWRNFTADPQPMTAVGAYRRQFPHARIDTDTPVLVLAADAVVG